MRRNDLFFLSTSENSIQNESDLRSELVEKSKKLSHIFSSSKDGITLFDQDNGLVEINQACCDIFELEREDILNMKIGHHIRSECKDDFEKMMTDLKRFGYVRSQFPIVLGNGKEKFIELSITSSAYKDLNLSIIRDISSERALFEELMENKEKFNSIFDHALDGILIWNKDRMIVDANPAACKMFNLTSETIRKYNIFDFLEGKSVSTGKLFQQELEEKGEIRAELEFTIAGGEKKFLEFTSKKSIHGDLYMTIYRDITETKAMIVEIKESEERFRRLFEGAMDGMAIIHHGGLIKDVNRAFVEMANFEKDDVVGSHYDDIRGDCDITWDYHAANGRNGEGKRWNPVTESVHTYSFTVSYNIYPNHHLVIVRDVTKIKRSEEIAKRTETSNVLSELAAGVAHEIRNPLSSIKAFLQLLKGNDSVNQDLLNVVGTEMKEVEEFVNEFLLLSKRELVSYEEVNMVDLLDSIISSLSNKAMEHHVEIITRTNTSIYCVCIKSHIRQALYNIIENGIESMVNGGTLLVTLSMDQDIMIEVADEGTGIPHQIIHKLGEPYYNTAEKGTGLGLMVSYKVIEEHGGSITVTSKDNIGTRFVIGLPLDSKQARQEIEDRRQKKERNYD
ncbi:PAS domain-containing sensor histidine kinase [Alkalihalobacillus sp. CinArs1]|uniref:PAS domain-containing sensor histidine kinase n=1 Tax=Alkalihalobacillus sp. CinArs1 TaxID=2995314 RepID=UPI0022DCFEBA|nr:PAS domain-containing sensor histidine kinase [Alkalihalobacillus sp. CinArs1]